jgi:aryl-alcohol dehydrogenase-like predicted oxidoreductase
MQMKSVPLGKAGPTVSRVALGCMAMSGMYGPSDESESIATIHAALEAGITLLDTGDFYGMGHNEMLIGRALEGRRNEALLSVKFGAMRAPNGAWVGIDGRPQAVKNSLSYTLQRLRTDHIDIYRLSRVDPAVPIEDTVGAIAEMIQAGYVRHIGLSEAGVETLRRAHAAHPICDLQIEYSIASRGIEPAILPAARELGIAITAYGLLSRGLFTSSPTGARGDFRGHLPRFHGENFKHNQALTADLARLAGENDSTPAQLATAWALAKGDDIIPLIGARTRKQLHDSLSALAVHLSREDMAQLEHIGSRIAGTRYDPTQMKMLDSERESGARSQNNSDS